MPGTALDSPQPAFITSSSGVYLFSSAALTYHFLKSTVSGVKNTTAFHILYTSILSPPFGWCNILTNLQGLNAFSSLGSSSSFSLRLLVFFFFYIRDISRTLLYKHKLLKSVLRFQWHHFYAPLRRLCLFLKIILLLFW